MKSRHMHKKIHPNILNPQRVIIDERKKIKYREEEEKEEEEKDLASLPLTGGWRTGAMGEILRRVTVRGRCCRLRILAGAGVMREIPHAGALPDRSVRQSDAEELDPSFRASSRIVAVVAAMRTPSRHLLVRSATTDFTSLRSKWHVDWEREIHELKKGFQRKWISRACWRQERRRKLWRGRQGEWNWNLCPWNSVQIRRLKTLERSMPRGGCQVAQSKYRRVKTAMLCSSNSSTVRPKKVINTINTILCHCEIDQKYD